MAEEAPRDLAAVIALLEAANGHADLKELDLGGQERSIPLGHRSPGPPRHSGQLDLWQRGLLDFIPGRGRAVHATVLAVRGETEELTRRFWLAQQELILPIVERVRLAIVAWLIQQCGPGWLEHLVPAAQVGAEEQAGPAELGALAHHVFRSNGPLRHPHFLTVSNLAWSWRKVRNARARKPRTPRPA